MISLQILIVVSVITFCIGGLVGAIISRALIPPEQQKDLETRLQTSRQDLEKYQQDVAKHFAYTSELVNSLTQSYKEVHEHLAKGAIQLTNSEISKQMLDAGESNLGIEGKESMSDVELQPPRDWAPKDPGQAGMLSEEFGLNDDGEEEGYEPIPGSSQKEAG